MPRTLSGPGEHLGSYRLVRLIGRGGMGAVYLAEHLRIPKQAAIKILLPELCANEKIVKRFFNEAQTASRIRHPGIVEILDCDVVDERAFIVMELLDGESLGAFLRRNGPLVADLPFLLGIGASIASAMSAAHSNDIVHRDLKPDNVQLHMAHPTESTVTMKILDFGIAKLARSSSSTDLNPTGAVILGTPQYMSPEQIRGARLVDRRSDIYSLGCILYQATCGAPLFAAESTADLIAAHLHAPPTPLSQRIAGVPPALDNLISDMVAKAPEVRPQHMDEVLAVLRKCGASLGIDIERLVPASPVLRLADYHSISGSGHTLVLPADTSREGTVWFDALPVRPETQQPEPIEEQDASRDRVGGEEERGDRGWTGAAPETQQQPEPIEEQDASRGRVASEEEEGPGLLARVVGLVGDSARKLWTPERTSVRAPDHVEPRRPAVPRVFLPTRRASPQDRLTRLIADNLPPPLKVHQDLIIEFLSGSFGSPSELWRGVLRFGRVRIGAFRSHEFFCVFLAGGVSSGAADQLGTRTFRTYVDPIEQHLNGFDRDIPKVVIAITDSIFLGAGVQQKIVQFREEYGAIVVPIYTKELKLKKLGGTLDRLLWTRLQEHCPPNYFLANEPTDRTTVFGVGDLVSQIISQITGQASLLAIYAPPCSGKTSLINLVEESLDGVVAFHELRCSEPATHNIIDLVRDFAPDAPELVSTVPIRLLIHRHVDSIAGEAKKNGLKVALVLEDADWLVGLLVDSEVDVAQRNHVREFWSALAEITRLKRAALIVTGTRTHALLRRRLGDWESPVAGVVEAHRIPTLDVTALHDYLQTKGSAMNLSHSDDAVAAIYELTGGHIFFVRSLCARIVENGRRKAKAVSDLHVDVPAVRAAASDLIADGTSFYGHFFQPFPDVEQDVMSVIAQTQPKDVATIARRLGRAPDAEVVAALDAVKALGLAEAIDRRFTVLVPMFGDWIRRNRPEQYRRRDQPRGPSN